MSFLSITARRHFGTQDRTRYLFIAQKASRTWRWSFRKWRQFEPNIRCMSQSTTDGPRKMADCDGDEMFLASEYEGPVLPWDRFRRWVTCFCVVTFDLELGQALEVSTTSVHASRSAQSWALNAEYLSMCLWWIRYGLSCFNVMILIYSVTARLPRSYRTDGPWGEGHYTDFELMTVMISLQLSRRIRFIRHFIRLLYTWAIFDSSLSSSDNMTKRTYQMPFCAPN